MSGPGPWTADTRERIREVQDRLLAMSDWARSSHATPADTDLLLAPYRELIDSIYTRDLPLAKLADSSDLLLHAHGPAASGPAPRVSTVTRLLSSTRDEVTKLAMQLAGITALRVPRGLDMAFMGVAEGSLFVGFSVESNAEGELTREAIRTIAQASQLVSTDSSVEEIAKVIPDPATRDIAVAAVRKLSPSGQIGISDIDLLGTQVVGQTSLSTETRRLARGIMAQRASHESPVTFIGTIREVDLDAERFEIRNVEGHPDVRCAHQLDENDVKELMDKRVRVRGIPEYGARRVAVRLLWVSEVEPLDD